MPKTNRPVAYAVVAALTALFMGCADALPRQRPEGELASALKSAEQFASQAERNAASAKAERERAEQLYAEMESLKGRIEAAEARCASGLRQVVDVRNRAERVFLQRAAQAKKAKRAAAEAEAKPAAAPSATPTPVEPEHSPSDAPIGNAPKASLPAKSEPAHDAPKEAAHGAESAPHHDSHH